MSWRRSCQPLSSRISSAERAGLRQYDVVTSIAGMTATGDSLRSAKAERDFDEEVRFDVRRGTKHLRIDVPIGVRPH